MQSHNRKSRSGSVDRHYVANEHRVCNNCFFGLYSHKWFRQCFSTYYPLFLLCIITRVFFTLDLLSINSSILVLLAPVDYVSALSVLGVKRFLIIAQNSRAVTRRFGGARYRHYRVPFGAILRQHIFAMRLTKKILNDKLIGTIVTYS